MIICILFVELEKMNKKIIEKKEMFVVEPTNINPSAITCENMGNVDSSNRSIIIFNKLFGVLNIHLSNLFFVHHLYTQKLV